MNSIVTLLHDITQEDYGVHFHSDFKGMVRIEFTNEWDQDFYEHEHLGYPDCDPELLEKKIVESLIAFRKKLWEDKE